jgi:hypothetical protein
MLNDTFEGRSNNSFDASGFSALLIDNLNQFADISRRVNSGVRFLLNAVAQSSESATLNLDHVPDRLACSYCLNAVSLAQRANVDAEVS